MAFTPELRELGMGRRIPRRDFLNGVALGVAGAATARPAGADTQAPATAAGVAAYPPARLGLRGQYPAAIEAFAAIARGAHAAPSIDVDTGETYDLVVVGGGLSGLSAAYFWHSALPNQRVLVLDNHDDFGGHAKRNEFTYNGRTFLGYGGTMSVATPYPYSYMSKALLTDLGIDVHRNREFADRDLFEKYRLGPGMFFDREHFGEDRLVAGNGRLPWHEFLARAPLSRPPRRDLVRLHGTNPDYLAGKTPMRSWRCSRASATRSFCSRTRRWLPRRCRTSSGRVGATTSASTPCRRSRRPAPAVSASTAWACPRRSRSGRAASRSTSPTATPRSRACWCRGSCRRRFPARHDMHTIVKAPPVAYDRLDAEGTPTRLRLNSTVTRVRLDGPPQRPTGARISYLRGGKMHQVRAESVVLACYNALIPKLLPELPVEQQQALAYPVKVPMLYTNVLLRRWTSFQTLGVASINAPGMYHPSNSLDPGSTVGGYKGVTTPDEPIVVHMVRNPNRPGLPRKEQNRLGQQELLTMTFHDFELSIRRQLSRMLAGTDFDPAADIVGLAVNRWPDGYSYTYDTLGDPEMAPEQRPHVIGRRRFGPIAIANADAGAAAFTNQAFDEAHRAVQELLVGRGLA